jgi:hypothetical protein
MLYLIVDDVSGGGHQKSRYASTVVPGKDEADANERFKRVTGRSIYDRSCSCCGPDYLVSETKDKELAVKWAMQWADHKSTAVRILDDKE